jgi:natural product precursor
MKVSKFVLRESTDVLLSKEEMKLILGGSTYRCFCSKGGREAYFFNVEASTWRDAIWGISYTCPYGGGCFE